MVSSPAQDRQRTQAGRGIFGPAPRSRWCVYGFLFDIPKFQKAMALKIKKQNYNFGLLPLRLLYLVLIPNHRFMPSITILKFWSALNPSMQWVFFLWQLGQRHCKFLKSLDPPFANGWMWSSSKNIGLSFLTPHDMQTQPMFERLIPNILFRLSILQIRSFVNSRPVMVL